MAKVIIIGAGLAGSLLSLFLAKRGIETEVYEARGDMRRQEMSAGRSINLALSDRGIAALKQVGMDEYMLGEAVPMLGRMIHSVDGTTKLLPYSGRKGEYINSVSRGGLNIALINEADKYSESKFFFNQKCVDFDCETGEAILEGGKRTKGDTVIATDGAGSAVRQAMMNGCVSRFNYEQKFLEHGYKELHIPPKSERSAVADGLTSSSENSVKNSNFSDAKLQPPATAGGSDFAMEKNALHIWARREFLMIALPNFDGSFTCTLFLAFEGENSFESIVRTASRSDLLNNNSEISNNYLKPSATADGSDRLLEFFETNFPDAVPLMPTLVEDFFTNPTGNLGTVKCLPWNIGGKALLLGDSAHAMVPFYGQGMNCAFEDCRVLDSLIEKHGTENWKTVFEEYTLQRKPNADAICDLAEENFFEMRDAVADPVFQKKRELETLLEQTFPDYFSKYSMVTFREDLPYAVAKEKGNAQDKLLMEICANVENVGEIDLNEVLEKVKAIG
ncbi:MAG: FAD-dependent monooxygenase [Pyrinomonadaceae bacterium]|nr:FAD-dependent monooxygenase [Pyrinomonadaceae bacterium]